MIVSVSDLLKILDKVPVWKTLVELPKRVTALEEKVAQLEKTPAVRVDPAEQCPICRAEMRVETEREAPLIAGRRDGKIRIMACERCGKTFPRNRSPAKGYF